MSSYAKVDIGGLTLYRGDCLRIMPCLPNKSVDCVMKDKRESPRLQSWDESASMFFF